jgi:hypothetical protein
MFYQWLCHKISGGRASAFVFPGRAWEQDLSTRFINQSGIEFITPGKKYAVFST